MSDGTDTPAADHPGRVPANRYAVFGLLTAVGLAADLISKEIVFSWPGKLTGRVEYWWWEGHAGIQTSLNEGALFGLGQGQVALFAAVSVAAAIAIPVWLFLGRAAHDWWLTVALGGVMAGVLGNLYDRLGLPGEVWPEPYPRAGEAVYAVRDWILWQASNDLRWPNFNLADAFLVVGAAVLFVRALLEPKAPDGETAAATTASPPDSHSS